jgi:hypothetical protein
MERKMSVLWMKSGGTFLLQLPVHKKVPFKRMKVIVDIDMYLRYLEGEI